MIIKQINANFRSISEEELRRVNGGKLNIKQGLIDILDMVDLIQKVDKKINELVKEFIDLGREFTDECSSIH